MRSETAKHLNYIARREETHKNGQDLRSRVRTETFNNYSLQKERTLN